MEHVTQERSAVLHGSYDQRSDKRRHAPRELCFDRGPAPGPPATAKARPRQAAWRKPIVWGAPWSGAGSFAQRPQSVPVASQQARTHNTRCLPCNSSGQGRERPPRLCSAATVHWPVAAGMSWESDASSCVPPTLEDPTAEPLSNQLEALRLKVSPAMKEEVSNVLEALTGEGPAARTCPPARTLGYQQGKPDLSEALKILRACWPCLTLQTSSLNASMASSRTASTRKRRPKCGLALHKCIKQRYALMVRHGAMSLGLHDSSAACARAG